MAKTIRRTNYRLTVTLATSHLKASTLLDHNAMEKQLDKLAKSITRHTDGIGRIVRESDEHAECSICGNPWHELTDDQAADPDVRLDGHSTAGEPGCCVPAVNEFRDAHGLPRLHTPDAETPRGQRDPLTPEIWGVDLTGAHHGEAHTVSRYCNGRQRALVKLDRLRAALDYRLNHTSPGPEGKRPLVLVIDPRDIERLEATRFLEWAAKKGPSVAVTVRTWDEWAAEREDTSPDDQPRIHSQEEALTIGLTWLYDTEQPDGATVQPAGGVTVRGEGNRSYSFCPEGAENLPVVIIAVTDVEPGEGFDDPPKNPLEPGELEALANALKARGYPVSTTWNGHPAITGSVGLATEAHATLRAAVANYRKGCPTHPDKGVFCHCPGWQEAFRRALHPQR